MSLSENSRIALFVTCLVDMFRPNVGFAALKLLETAGCTVEVPDAQTCCGQPAYNSGDRTDAAAIACQVVDVFEGYDYVVIPSGSCGGMISHHYVDLLADDPAYADRARKLAMKSFELVSFLADVLKLDGVAASYDGTVTYHDSCSGLRELKIKAQPRQLLASVEGAELAELDDAEVCCGFGGTFCVKYSDVSVAMVSKKVANIAASGADTLAAGDIGCLMNMAGRLKREGQPTKVFHIAEILAGMAGGPGIAEREEG